MRFVIPSFQRPNDVMKKSLFYLTENDVKPQDIWLFVRKDDHCIEQYMNLKKSFWGLNIIETERKGIGKTHNLITETFDENEFIVEIDDDLTDLLDNEKNPVNFLKFCEEMKEKMIEVGASYGGTYQVLNKMFMSNNKQYTTDLRYMLGCVRLRFVRKDIILETNYAEDFENCILHYLRDGVILKNNWVCPKTKNYSEGGCDNDGRNLETEKHDKEHLSQKYPDLCKLFQRKNQRWDLRLHKKATKVSKRVPVPYSGIF